MSNALVLAAGNTTRGSRTVHSFTSNLGTQSENLLKVANDAWRMAESPPELIVIEPFYGGSHKQLADLLCRSFKASLYSLPAKKWPWRMRTSALHFALSIPSLQGYKTLLASANLNLCDLLALREDLRSLRKVLYFHENQLVYPVRKHQDRDFQFGYNQIISCLAADCILFNSQFNMDSFLQSIPSFLNLMPDCRPQGIPELIRSKCHVLYFPLELPKEIPLTPSSLDICWPNPSPSHSTVAVDDDLPTTGTQKDELATLDVTTHNCEPVVSNTLCVSNVPMEKRILHIVWPHRWEHDKGPQEFCEVLLELKDLGLDFKVSLLGRQSQDMPDDFKSLLGQLGGRVRMCGFVDRPVYWAILQDADVVVSTAKHEFFGVSMLEATYSGCYPLCPKRLVYPEIYPKECLYSTRQQLVKALRGFCLNPSKVPCIKDKIDWSKYSWTSLEQDYSMFLQITPTKITSEL